MLCLGPNKGIRALNDLYLSNQPDRHDGLPEPFRGMLRMIVIADTDERAHALAAPAYRKWYQTLTALWRRQGITPPYKIDEDIDTAIDGEMMLVGSARTVSDMLRHHIDETGVNYVSVHALFGNLSVDAALNTINELSSQVIPRLQLQRA